MRRREISGHLIFILLMSSLFLLNIPLLNDHLEGLLTDIRFRMRNLIYPPEVPEDIVIVAVDEESLKRYGRWPWPRQLQARLLEEVLRTGPRAVGIDIIYGEPESPLSDRRLGEVLSHYRDRAVLALGCEVQQGKTFRGTVPEVLSKSTVKMVKEYSLLRAPDAYRCLLPPEDILDSLIFGHVYSMPDRDGKRRWEYLYIRYGEELIPSFSLQVARVASGEPPDSIRVTGGWGVEVAGRFIPTDPYGRLLINYIGKEGTFPYIPAHRVLEGEVPLEALKGKVVLIGVTALTLYDMVITPFSANMPGVEKNATVVSNILSGGLMKEAPRLFNVIFIILSGLTGMIIRPTGARRTLLTLLGISTTVLTVNLFAFCVLNWRLNLLYPMGTVILQGGGMIVYRYLLEERRQRQVRRIFSRYVSPKIVQRLIESPDAVKLGGVRQEVTVLFSDLKGFTTLSEKLSPEEVVSLLNEYFKEMSEVIFHHDGTLDKFVGDEIMAFWGAPIIQPEHPEMAVRCAIDMIKRLKLLQKRFHTEGKPKLEAGIGINTGEVVVGNIGSEDKKMDYTVIGDHVNLASRIQDLTRRYQSDILLSEFTYNRLSKEFLTKLTEMAEVTEVGMVKVRGRDNPINLYSIRIP